LVAAHAAMGTLVAVEQYYRNSKFSPPPETEQSETQTPTVGDSP
jgi:hypothetical protein